MIFADAVPVARPMLDWTQIIVAFLLLAGTVVTALSPIYIKVWRNAKTHAENQELLRGIDGAVNQKGEDEPTLRENVKKLVEEDLPAIATQLSVHTVQDADNFAEVQATAVAAKESIENVAERQQETQDLLVLMLRDGHKTS